MGKKSPALQQTQSRGQSGAAKHDAPMEEEVYEDVDSILRKAIDEIWEMFDDDGNGLFDIDETTSFIRHTLQEMGESPEFNQADFIQCFTQFAPGGRGFMTKDEMTIFIKKVAGLNTEDDEANLEIPDNPDDEEGDDN